ncbi:hypothetical protein LJC58_07130 [Lachnospiraceae bacterium OttesenSCG-928-D06]|nr:hypothetical protein [Lachnospiraceae bacterium OttesenSCG-928-D06]MDL2302109.1 hypothetical protein [Lachnospiraceae bacterium OttesenSCG-928-D06]
MSKKADYPDWVMVHKKKGTYINKVGDKYYLYAAHSERIPGTKKVRRVSDGYLGRITEQDGFIPVQNKLRDIPVIFEIGISYTILSVTGDLQEGLCRSFPKYGTIVYSCAVLSFIYGTYSKELYEQSYLHLLFEGIVYPSSFTSSQLTGIMRGLRMLEERIPTTFGADWATVLIYFSNIRLARINQKYYLSPLSETAVMLSNQYEINWRNSLWQK